MLVSARVDEALRRDVDLGVRPCPEYLHLERIHGVKILDWSQLPFGIRRRSLNGSVLHAISAVRRLQSFDVVFSDGEHIGMPLALILRAMRIRKPHLVLGHHVTTGAKRMLWRYAGVQNRMDRILLHSRHQMRIAECELMVPAERLRLVPYFADERFWSPRGDFDGELVVSAGREHRDYATLAEAAHDLSIKVVVAAGSFFSPNAAWRLPKAWPANFEVRPEVRPVALRDLYAKAGVVVVPLLPTDFQAGVTTVLEAMAMGKPVIVSATPSQVDIVEHGITGILVPPQDPAALRAAVASLLADPDRRKQLGLAARRAVEQQYSLEVYSSRLATHMSELARAAVGSPTLVGETGLDVRPAQ